jgi:hypothetical protein
MPPEYPPARLFTLRLWQAAVDDAPGAVEWRGKVQSLPDGEAYYFRDWPGLIRHLETMLEPPREEAAHSETQDGGNL